MIILIIIALSLLVLGSILLFGGSDTTTGETTTGETTTGDTTTSTICPRDTCIHQHTDEDFTIQYNSELNLNSTCDEIKDYIIANLERINPDTFRSSDDTPLTNSMKKELIFVLENRSNMITNNNGTSSPGIRFKFCCPTEQDCLL